MVIGLGELFFVQQQALEPIAGAKRIFDVHLDRIKGTDLGANLAAHAHGNIDVEGFGMRLQLAGMVGLFGRVFDDVNALRRTFLLADQTGDTTQAQFRIVTIINQEGKAAGVLLRRKFFFRVLHRWKALFAGVTAQEISGSFRHTFNDAGS